MKIEGFFFNSFDSFNLNLSFNFNSKKIIGLIGESGSGKSTFLKCISGLVRPMHGYLRFNNKLLFDSKEKIFITSNNRQIGHVLQNPILFNHLSLFGNIKLFINPLSLKYYDLNQLLSLLNLNKIKKNDVKLSGGERQRISILQSLLINPELLLFDESLSFQDIRMKHILISLFKNLNFFYKVPIIYVSHDISNIEAFVDEVYYINNGKLLN